MKFIIFCVCAWLLESTRRLHNITRRNLIPPDSKANLISYSSYKWLSIYMKRTLIVRIWKASRQQIINLQPQNNYVFTCPHPQITSIKSTFNNRYWTFSRVIYIHINTSTVICSYEHFSWTLKCKCMKLDMSQSDVD